MSQEHRLPQFNFQADDYFQAPQHSSANTLPQHQWRQSFGAPGHPGLRPSSSIDSLQPRRRTASSSRSEKTYNFNHARSFADRNENINSIDPSLGNGLLSVNRSSGRPSMSDLQRAPDPIARFYAEDAGPWTAEKIPRGHIPSRMDGRSLSSHLSPNLEFSSYRNPPGSELESTGTGVAADSGYGTISQPATQSIASMEPAEYNQDVPAEINFHMTAINFATGSSRPANLSRSDKTDRTKSTKARIHQHRNALTCQECGETAKCPSEFKKHTLKHVKPFKCDVRNCRRTRGFTTVNDLNRHKKSVHNMTVGPATKSYQCASEHCRTKEKIWPRLDNFKQHINRMHKEENVEDLIKRSLCRGKQRSDSSTPQPLSVAPMDTTLAGIGFESNFSMPSYNTPGSANITPGQTSQTWGNIDVSPGEFEIDDNNAAANQEFYSSSSQNPDQGMSSGYRQPDVGQSTGMESNTPVSWSSGSTSTNLRGLSTLADVACNASSNSSSASRLTHQTPFLSKEPQTKAAQQNKALSEISKHIAKNISHNSQGKSLDEEVFRILSRATGLEKSGVIHSTSDTSGSSSDNERTSSSDDLPSASHEMEAGIETMSRGELVKGLQALAKIIQRNKGKKNMNVGQRQTSYSGSTETCSICLKTLPRRCDMKKHMKRHTRPYGCTFPKCKRSFGSKSDWKRHENSQHFQLETWRCQQPKEQFCCAELFYRREVFEDHLKDKHGMSGDAVASEVKSCRIGRNGQGQFWCGFCERIIPLQLKRSAAWDERFNHIDEHFKKKEIISDWLCLEARKPKGEVMKEMDKSYFGDEDDVTGEDLQDEDSPPPSQSMGSQHQTPSDGSDVSPILVEASPPDSSNPRKRPSSTDMISSSSSGSAPAGRRREIVYYCCQCGIGPYSSRMYPSCMSCEHAFCGECPRKAVTSADVEMDIFAHGN